MSQMNPPPDAHRSPDGKWWWDGQQWQPVPEPPPAAPTPEPQRRIPRWPIVVGVVLGLLLLFGVCTAAINSSSSNKEAAKTTATPTATATAAPTPTAKPATPTPAPPTPPPGPQIMMQQQGSGIANSTEFNAPSHWKLSYSYDCSNFGFNGNFQVFLYQGSRPVGILANDLGKGESKSTDVYQGGDHLHLQMNSECSWSVKATTA